VNGSLPDGATALHWATYWDDTNTVDLLIRAGAKVNAPNEGGGNTSISRMRPIGMSPIVEKLLAAGAILMRNFRPVNLR